MIGRHLRVVALTLFLVTPAAMAADTDGDALPDEWEMFGYDHDNDGVVDVPLHAMGFDPMRKDIAVAYVWMEAADDETLSHEPDQAVLDAVVEMFARAPVSNPDGSRGITLHFVNFGSAPHDVDLNPVWDEFDAIMDPRVPVAERQVYHRMLHAHGYGGGTSSGLARGLPSSDSIESLGTWLGNPGSLMARAGTIAHELGHNLGLRHGGPDDINYKPNHLSVMGYFNQVLWLVRDGEPHLDYERFRLRALVETDLNEAEGLDAVNVERPLRRYGVRYWNTVSPRSKNRAAHRRVDWDGDRIRNETSVSVDVNRDGFLGTLSADYPEWEHLIFNGGSIGGMSGDKAKRVVLPLVEPELTEEMHLEILRNTVEVW